MTDFKAGDAQQLLDNPIFNEAFANIREEIIIQLEILPPDHDRIRDELVISLQMIRALHQRIQDYVDTDMLNEDENAQKSEAKLQAIP